MFLIIKLLCIETRRLFSVLNHDVFISKTSETKSLDNKLEWMNLDEEEFQNSKEAQKI